MSRGYASGPATMEELQKPNNDVATDAATDAATDSQITVMKSG